jgi:hypothetical protein
LGTAQRGALRTVSIGGPDRAIATIIKYLRLFCSFDGQDRDPGNRGDAITMSQDATTSGAAAGTAPLAFIVDDESSIRRFISR